MPVSTTAYNWCNLHVELDDASGTSTDISEYVTSFGFDWSRVIATYHVAGLAGTYSLECKTDTTISMSIVLTPDADEARDMIDWWRDNGGLKTVTWDSPDSSVGSTRKSGEFRLVSVSQSADMGSADPVLYEIELQVNGAITTETIAS